MIGILMGSKSDWPVMKAASETLDSLGIKHEVRVLSAHRTPDLALEYAVGGSLKDAIKLCEKERDYPTREILEQLLADTEMDHAYWLEQQLGLIEKLGLENYIQSQMGA